MTKRMLIDALHTEETRVVIADENQIYDFDFVSTAKKQLKGNIYLAKITRVEPSLQAAFVEYGGGKQGFLPFSEIHADYYQIPISDRKRLMEEAQREDTSEDADTSGTTDNAGEPGSPEEPLNITGGTTFPVAIPDMPVEPGNVPAATIEAESIPPLIANDSADMEPSHPAYLTQGAIDITPGEEHDLADSGGNIPISQALASVEQSMPEPEETAPELKSEETSDAPTSESVETLSSEEEEYQNRPKKNLFFKRYKIQEVIRRGQIVLVQVIKEERGNKGVSLTTYLSLAGRYCVLMPNSPKDGGISRKIASADDRKRLKAISTELRLAQGMSVIIRTAGMDRTRAEIKRDYDYLVKLWNRIREDTLVSNAPALIYEESDIIKRAIRDQYTGDIEELIIEGDAGYKAAKDFMKLLLPSHTAKIRHYNEATPLFYAYNIEEQLLSMHDPVVKLRSGGYIVMNPTEALISIDVNSGRATGERNIEETATKTNLEAAAEVARQLRLRDLAGLIVIDFIDMLDSRNRRAVEKALKDALKSDRAKIQLGRISPFGLLEMSRQRLRSSISETNMVQCPHCLGRGVIRSNESMSIQMIRAIEKEASAGTWSSLRLIAPQTVALHMLNNKRDILRAIEQRHGLTVQVLIGPELTSSEFNLEKMRRAQNERSENAPDRDRDRRPRRNDRNDRNRAPETVADDTQDMEMQDRSSVIDAQEPGREDSLLSGEGNARRSRNRRRRGGRGRSEYRKDQDQQAPNSDAPLANPDIELAGAEPAENFAPREADNNNDRPYNPRRRERGGRGRRRWRDPSDRNKPGEESYNDQKSETASASENIFERTDGNALPAFATEERLPTPEPVQHRTEPVVQQAIEPMPMNGPPKKGWWQKMIELDD